METIKNFVFNSYWGIFLYWIPLIVCFIGYTVKTIKNYLKDKKERETKADYYYPTDTIRSLMERFLASICPVVNILIMIFNFLPGLVEKIFDLLGDILNKPLVPIKKK